MKITKSSTLRIMVIALMSFVMIENASAQSARAGIKGGLNASNLYIDDNVTDENARIGFHAGVYGQLFPSDVFTLQAELLYSTKGSKAVYNNVFGDQEVKYNLNYLDLPVLAVFKVADVLEIHAGGYASYLLGANISYEGDFVNDVDEIDKDHLKSLDYGLVGGVGINFGAVQVGARYNLGLAEIADSDEARDLLGNSKNSNAQVYIAFDFMQD